MLDFEKICRLCMRSNQKLTRIFDDESPIGLAAMLNECSKHKVVRYDGLPQHVCGTCVAAVKNAHRFITDCENSYQHLMQILNDPSNTLGNKVTKHIVSLGSNCNVDKETQTDESAVHVCVRCDQKFMDIEDLQLHQANEHKGCDIVCRYCSKKFDRLGYLRSHIATAHPESGYKSDSQCHICNKHFSRRDHMLRHLRDIHKVQLPTKRKAKTHKEDFDYHDDCDDDQQLSDTSEQNMRETTRANAIEPMHTVLINENCKVYNLKLEDLEEVDAICTIMDETKHTNDNYIFNSNNRELQRSTSTFNEQSTTGNNAKACVTKDFACDECGKTYASEVRYINHQITKHNASEFVMEKQSLLNTALVKDQPLKSVEIVDKDEIKSENDVDDDNDNDSTTNNDPIDEASSDESNSLLVPDNCANESKAHKSKSSKKKLYECDECKITFATNKQHKRHCATKHNEGKFECSTCERTFSRKTDLKRHLPIHNKKQLSCRECAQNFNTKHELDAHKKSEGHDKPMLCPECGLRCKSSSSLMVHMRRHTGEKPYKCKFCNKGFPRSDDLKQHEKYHTGERTHFCETCGKGFQRKYHLTTHLRVHTGEKPYKCPHCSQAFSQGHDLKLHIRRHTGERLRCEYCDASFLQGYKIRQHKLIEHGIKEEAPTQRLEKFTSLEQQQQQIKEIQQLQNSMSA